ncbi:hypothetical protein HII31_09484 [Pseudocercospora fuligena]|uniref:F-box domain-containing protein n=1 Tax=Pseudocercospora fuligena TaxID=685502 RepID=A0A8H6REA4_9PEZI|nr:hypothetical protein HII31_09484 [Pseudocercospora fuligena]
MSSQSVKPAGLDRLSALPVEIKLQVFSKLSTKDLEACQKTSKHFHALINEETNSKTLYGPIQDRNRHRLAESISRLYDLQDVSLIEGLARWITQRGLNPDGGSRDNLIRHFLELWTLSRSKPKKSDSPTLDNLTDVAEALVDLHIKTHLEPSDYDFDFILGGLTEFVHFLHDSTRSKHRTLKRYDIDRKALEDWHHQVLSDPQCLAAPGILPTPMFALTPLTYEAPAGYEFTPHESDEFELPGLCSLQRLAELFGLLRIPDYRFVDRQFEVEIAGNTLGFCVKTEQAFEIVKQAVQGEAISEEQRALVLEEMYLF